MSRLSRIGLPLSIVSSTARRRECFCTCPRQRVEVASPRVRSERLPFWERCARGSNRGVDVRWPIPARLWRASRRWRDRGVEVSAVRRLPPRAVDEVSEAAAVTIEPGQRFFRILRRRAVFHGDEFFSDAHIGRALVSTRT